MAELLRKRAAVDFYKIQSKVVAVRNQSPNKPKSFLEKKSDSHAHPLQHLEYNGCLTGYYQGFYNLQYFPFPAANPNRALVGEDNLIALLANTIRHNRFYISQEHFSCSEIVLEAF